MFTSRLVSNLILIRSFSTTIAAMISLTLLSGCLVHTDGTKTYKRTTENFHLYQPNDFIEYNVSGPNVSGRLRVDWSTPGTTLVNPGTGNGVTVLQETSTLTINGATTTVVRYIAQDPDGTINLVALDDSNLTDTNQYWINDGSSSTTPQTTLMPVSILQSPVVVTTTSISNTFNVFDGCVSPNGCSTYLGSQSETYDVPNDHVSITTDGGLFDTLMMTYSGNKQSSTSSSLPIELDVRDTCGGINATFSGTSYVFPEVGIVAMYVTCSANTGTTTNYTFSFTRAGGTIALPSPS